MSMFDGWDPQEAKRGRVNLVSMFGTVVLIIVLLAVMSK